MQLESVTIKNFRCFSSLSINFGWPIALIEGANGSGKTTLLEALHYACYLRSFRTHLPAELLKDGAASFFVKAVVTQQNQSHEVQVGFAQKKRLVRLDQTAITTYKQLFDVYRVVTITADDVEIIRQGPELRRSFLDQLCVFLHPEYTSMMRKFRHILYSRNALLKKAGANKEVYDFWSEQLWIVSHALVATRKAVLEQLDYQLQELLSHYFQKQFSIVMSYQPAVAYQNSYEEFATTLKKYTANEMRFGRSLFGSHLDDISLLFQETKSRSHASRGQQKLIILLLKMAQVKLLKSSIVLLDDFMTDFDRQRITDLTTMLVDLKTQLIFTVPTSSTLLEEALQPYGMSKISLSDKNVSI